MRLIHHTTWAAAGALVLGAIGFATTPAPAPESKALVAHEWGTFSSFSGSDGKLLSFTPSNADLPQFVHSSVRYSKGVAHALISLETPVIYFYSQKPIKVSVTAQFPGGYFTDWFPEATRSENNAAISWPEVRIRPGEPTNFPTTTGPNHYYAARETDAAPIEVPVKNNEATQYERERYLFYRGIGNSMTTPLTVTAQGGDSFALKANPNETIGALLLIEVKGGKMRFRQVESMSNGSNRSLSLPANESSLDALKSTMVNMLVAAGLFDKEAKAMVKTWESTWFTDEGARVLYLLPNVWTNRVLPLQITPRPDVLVRVMVGRHDVLTPERERDIESIVNASAKGSEAEQAKANASLNKLGRFAAPARRQAELRIQGNR